MKKELYDQLTDIQKAVYDEHFQLYKKLGEKLNEIQKVLTAILEEANMDH